MNECTAILSIFPLQGDETQMIRSNRMHTLQSGFTRDRPVYLGTCTGLLSCSVPFEDGEWQFMCNTTDDPDDGIVVCMGCFFQKFPEVAELADLPLGFDAYRDDINQPWDIEKLE